jgi:hypothetical protein
MVNLTTVALDRYIAISSPFFYKVHATLRTTVFAIFGTWVVTALLLVPTLLTHSYEHHIPDNPVIPVCRIYTESW